MTHKEMMAGFDAFRAVAEVSSNAEGIAKQVSDTIMGDLNKLVTKVENWLDEDEKLDDYKLHRLALRLPTAIYRASEGVTQATVRAEIAKLAAAHVYDSHILEGREKTAADRKAGAELAAEGEELAAVLAKAVLADVKTKLDAAQALYEGVKKIMSARDTERTSFRGAK